jgi:hypothetical protein
MSRAADAERGPGDRHHRGTLRAILDADPWRAARLSVKRHCRDTSGRTRDWPSELERANVNVTVDRIVARSRAGSSSIAAANRFGRSRIGAGPGAPRSASGSDSSRRVEGRCMARNCDAVNKFPRRQRPSIRERKPSARTIRTSPSSVSSTPGARPDSRHRAWRRRPISSTMVCMADHPASPVTSTGPCHVRHASC